MSEEITIKKKGSKDFVVDFIDKVGIKAVAITFVLIVVTMYFIKYYKGVALGKMIYWTIGIIGFLYLVFMYRSQVSYKILSPQDSKILAQEHLDWEIARGARVHMGKNIRECSISQIYGAGDLQRVDGNAQYYLFGVDIDEEPYALKVSTMKDSEGYVTLKNYPMSVMGLETPEIKHELDAVLKFQQKYPSVFQQIIRGNVR